MACAVAVIGYIQCQLRQNTSLPGIRLLPPWLEIIQIQFRRLLRFLIILGIYYYSRSHTRAPINRSMWIWRIRSRMMIPMFTRIACRSWWWKLETKSVETADQDQFKGSFCNHVSLANLCPKAWIFDGSIWDFVKHVNSFYHSYICKNMSTVFTTHIFAFISNR